jgi:hypothetical protein
MKYFPAPGPLNIVRLFSKRHAKLHACPKGHQPLWSTKPNFNMLKMPLINSLFLKPNLGYFEEALSKTKICDRCL